MRPFWLVALAACLPEHVVWVGKTPDRTVPVRVVERGRTMPSNVLRRAPSKRSP